MFEDVNFDFETNMTSFPLKKYDTIEQEVIITSKNIHQYHPNYLKKLIRVHFVGVDMYEYSVQQKLPNVRYFTYTDEPIEMKKKSSFAQKVCMLSVFVCISVFIFTLTLFFIFKK